MCIVYVYNVRVYEHIDDTEVGNKLAVKAN